MVIRVLLLLLARLKQWLIEDEGFRCSILGEEGKSKMNGDGLVIGDLRDW